MFKNTLSYDSIFECARKEVERRQYRYNAIALKNTEKVIAAFRKHQVSDFYMKPTTGYAYVPNLFPEPMRWQLPCLVICMRVMK